MGLAEQRKALGYSQEGLAEITGVDRTTICRWENGKSEIQPSLRARYAAALQLDLAELDAQVSHSRGGTCRDSSRPSTRGDYGSREICDMIRREFLRILTVAGTLTDAAIDEADAVVDGAYGRAAEDLLRMNVHLWQVYRLTRAKSSVSPVVRHQLRTLTQALNDCSGKDVRTLRGAVGDLFQLAGELAFDCNRYSDAAAAYTFAASASRDAGSFDLWACALTRHAYVDMSEGRYQDAADTLSVAARIARRGDSALATRYWVAAVQAEACASLGNVAACERALDAAQEVAALSKPEQSSGWLRFDGSRLLEERGARYVQLGRLDLAERVLCDALGQEALSEGRSLRRRGAVLVDLAVIGTKRKDPERVLAYAGEALHRVRESSSGYITRKLRGLQAGFGPLSRDAHVAELEAAIGELGVTCDGRGRHGPDRGREVVPGGVDRGRARALYR